MNYSRFSIFILKYFPFKFNKLSKTQKLILETKNTSKEKYIIFIISRFYYPKKFKLNSIYYNIDFFIFFNNNQFLKNDYPLHSFICNKKALPKLHRSDLSLNILSFSDLFLLYISTKNIFESEIYNNYKSIKRIWELLGIFGKFYYSTNFRYINFNIKCLFKFSWLNLKMIDYKTKNTPKSTNVWFKIDSKNKKKKFKYVSKKKISLNYINLNEISIYNKQKICLKSSSFFKFSYCIIKNIFVMTELCDILCFKSPNCNVFFSKFFDSFCLKTKKFLKKTNFKLNFDCYTKRTIVSEIKLIALECSWVLVLDLYCKNLYFKLKEKGNVFLFNNLNVSNRPWFSSDINETQNLKSIKLYSQKIKGLLHKYQNLKIIWIRFLSENFLLNEDFRASEFFLYWTSKNLIASKDITLKNTLISLELIRGNCNIHRKSFILLFAEKFNSNVLTANLKKIPGKIEKIYCLFDLNEISNTVNVDLFRFYYNLGYVDLIRKKIQKMLFYSNGHKHLKILITWANIEYYGCYISTARLILHSLLDNQINIKYEFSLLLEKLYYNNWQVFIRDLKIFLEIYKDMKIIRKLHQKFVF